MQQYRETRDQYYYLIYSMLEEDARSGGPTKGALFWQWYAHGQKAPEEEGGEDGGMFGVFDTDSTWQLVQSFTNSMQELSVALESTRHSAAAAGEQNTCKSSRISVEKVKGCQHTWVKNRPGTGFEGTRCDIDINECARGTAGCDINAACLNTNGSYSCTCHLGYKGNGYHCSPTDALDQIKQQYVTLGRGKVACNEGKDVEFPLEAPGFAYDVLGAASTTRVYNREAPVIGSRLKVTPEQCMAACELAVGCDSFTYSPEGASCFLKSKGDKEACTKVETMCVNARGTMYPCGTWQTYWRAGIEEIKEKEQGTSKLALALKRRSEALAQQQQQQSNER